MHVQPAMVQQSPQAPQLPMIHAHGGPACPRLIKVGRHLHGIPAHQLLNLQLRIRVLPTRQLPCSLEAPTIRSRSTVG